MEGRRDGGGSRGGGGRGGGRGSGGGGREGRLPTPAVATVVTSPTGEELRARTLRRSYSPPLMTVSDLRQQRKEKIELLHPHLDPVATLPDYEYVYEYSGSEDGTSLCTRLNASASTLHTSLS